MPSFRSAFARHWRAYEVKYGSAIPRAHRRAAQSILQCRTPALGGSLYACEHCGEEHRRYHSCNHRSCPLCGQRDAMDWAEKQKACLLPLPYRMVTFTVPAGLRRVFRSNQRVCYAMFFRECAATLQQVAGEEKYLGGRLGFLGVLHSWTRKLDYHPHIHFLVPQGGLSPEGHWKRPPNPAYFLPGKKLSVALRIRMQHAMRTAHPELYAQVGSQVWYEAWVCHFTDPGNGAQAVTYLSRYVCQTALSRNRILADDGYHVTIEYVESNSGEKRSLTLRGEEFIRRFLQHVLPKGFKRIRTYGWLSPAAKKTFWRICTLIAYWPPASPQPLESPNPVCAKCNLMMHRLGKLARAPPPASRSQGARI